jgi:small subunit ribosomal protein S21
MDIVGWWWARLRPDALTGLFFMLPGLIRTPFGSCSGWKEVTSVTSVNLRPNESQDQLLKRFRKKVAKSGILSTVRRKRWFVSKSELRRIQKKKSIRRIKRRQFTEPE